MSGEELRAPAKAARSCDHVNDCMFDRCGCVIVGCHGIAPDWKTDEQLTLEDLSDKHWLVFNAEREVVGCHCGFEADNEQDCGWGDSVVEHLFRVAMDSA